MKSVDYEPTRSLRLDWVARGAMGVALAFSAAAIGAFATVSARDSLFVIKAGQAGMAEVLLARLALQRSTNSEVVAFARRMSVDHGKANAQLASIVKQQDLTPPSGIGAQNEALLQRLESENRAAFNNAYLKSQLPAHQQVLSLFQIEARNGHDPALVAFAKQTIPTIEEHISLDKREIAKLDSGGGTSIR